MTCRILYIIPARKGSRRFPGKNVSPCHGKPLYRFTVEAASGCRYDGDIVITTDYGREDIPESDEYRIRDRPAHLCTDESSPADVIADVLSWVSYRPDAIVLLQPTSPCRTSDDIAGALDMYMRHRPSAVVSVCETRKPPYYTMTIAGSMVEPVTSWDDFTKRTQDHPVTFRPNGAIYIVSYEAFMHTGRLFVPHRTMAYLMPLERSADIDYLSDMQRITF